MFDSSSDKNIVSVKDTKVGGDFVGRDKNTYLPKPSQVDIHNENYKLEIESNKITNEVMDKLNHYNSSLDNLRSLEIKLKGAGFDYLIDEALELKQSVSKLIMKHQNYKSAQKIITLILSDIVSIFNAKIKPKLKNISEESEIKYIFLEDLENEIQDKLGENVLDIYNDEIQGMAYFLTGNCHIEWK